jgi:hypothetical protein
MTPQNPFNTWENSDEYYNLQDEIGKIKIQQSDYDKIAPPSLGRRGHLVHNTDPRSLEFQRKLRALKERSRQGAINFNFLNKPQKDMQKSAFGARGVNYRKFHNN